MNSDELVRALSDQLIRWQGTLANVPLDRLEEEGVEGYYSVKDLVAHVMSNSRWSAAQLKGVITGVLPTPMDLYGQEEQPVLESIHFEHVNRWIFERYHDSSYQEVLGDFRAVFTELISSLQIASEEVLDQNAPWPSGPPLRTVAQGVAEHANEHLASLTTWLKRAWTAP